MLSLPTFVAGPLLVLVFAVTLKAVPATGFVRLSQGLGQNLKSAILPSVVLAIGSIAVYYRLLRADLIASLQEDFVTMARAKGMSTPYILIRHVLRPSSFSLLASAGLAIGSLFTGAFVVEALFQLPGVGYQLVQAIYSNDYLMVQGMALVAAIAFVVVNFGADLTLTFLDPRVRRA
jgi:peptide/nickel transport system permease protein